MIVTVLGALLLSDPSAEEDQDRFRDPPLPGHRSIGSLRLEGGFMRGVILFGPPLSLA